MSRLSKTMKKELAQIQPSSILAFNQEISSIPDIVKLTLGEPDFNTPDHVKQAAIKQLKITIATILILAGLKGYGKRRRTS